MAFLSLWALLQILPEAERSKGVPFVCAKSRHQVCWVCQAPEQTG